MSKLVFKDIPKEYESMKDKIQNETIQMLYSKFDFKYLTSDSHEYKSNYFNNKENEDITERFLLNYLVNFNFITYNFMNLLKYDHTPQITNIILCVEGECLFIIGITIDFARKLIQNLKTHQITILNSNTKNSHISETEEETDFNSEIDNFCSEKNIALEIRNNKLVKISIRALSGFLIRSQFCPTNFLKNKSLFVKNKEHFLNKEFDEIEFIVLRCVCSRDKALFYLVFHIKSLCIFMMKKIFHEIDFVNEIEFCKNYSHRCLTKFYGFVKKNKKIIGFIYEYLCNGSLHSFITSRKNIKISEMYVLTIINRLFQGIEYLHSNYLIHRDIKPMNILFDRNFLPFLSDFDTIRSIENISSEIEMTNDIGSDFYSSPEQFHGQPVSYSTDIYSFGLVIYFIFEKQNLISNFQFEKIKSLTDSSVNMQNLFNKCVQYLPSKRLTIEGIKHHIIKEINSLSVHEKYTENKVNEIKQEILTQFVFEGMILKHENYTFFEPLYVPRFEEWSGDISALNQIIEQIDVKMIEYHDFLIKQNNPASFIKLGDLYYNGKLIEQNYSKALNYYKLAADSNSFVKLGDIYYEGNGVEKDFSKAKEYYEKSANLNNSEALNILGDLYCYGEIVEQDYLKAKYYYELAAKLNNSKALKSLGYLYSKGYGVDQDYSKAKKYYELAAELYNSTALNNLGQLYEKGHGVEQNYNKAIEYYELAAELNDSAAINNLGFLYEKGHGVEQDYKKAKRFYKYSSELYNSSAFNNLGRLYFNGQGGKKNYSKAKNCYEFSANLKNPYAFNNLGYLYENGYGVEQDYSKAKEYYELGIKYKDVRALYNLGYLYEKGHGVDQNYTKAKEYYELAADHKDAKALNKLGNLYYDGKGVKQDYIKAKEYYEMSANLNNIESINNLGYLYFTGKGVNKDYLKAKEFFEKSAKYNNLKAIKTLGIIYEKGFGVKKDFLLAKQYYELAVKYNDPESINKLGNLYYYGLGVEQNYSKAKEYYELGAKNKNPISLYILGCMYEKGIGVEQNYLKAKDYYELSSQSKNPEAFLRIGNLYRKGRGVQKDCLIAQDYYELAAKRNNSRAFFYLAYFYINVDISKAIYYLLKSSVIHNERQTIYDSNGQVFHFNRYNKFCYRSFNDVGLIYLFLFDDIEKANDNIKQSAFGEYPFGQNNFGLMNELYFNEYGNAEYMYSKASKNNFALAEFNLGRFYEKNGNIQKSVEYYIKTSEDDELPLIFLKHHHHDELLEISKKFIICFTNLKLAEYYFSLNSLDESKKYFCKSFIKLEMNSYKFRFQINNDKIKNIFSYLKEFILNCPLFNFMNIESKEKPVLPNRNEDQFDLYDIEKFGKFEEKEKIKKDFIMIDEIVFESPDKLFDFANQNENLKTDFITEINDIIHTVEAILYTPPYSILFGRINWKKPIQKSKENQNFLKGINELFYEGFQ